jgi:hypothetical protein
VIVKKGDFIASAMSNRFDNPKVGNNWRQLF